MPCPASSTHDEWSRVEAGVKQRVRALEAFLDDVVRRASTRARRRASRPRLISVVAVTSTARPPASQPPNGVRIQVSGIDLIRDEHGELARARRQRARAVGRQLRHLEPPGHGADAARAVRLDAGAPGRRLPATSCSQRCGRRAPAGVEDPNVVVLTPGVYNSAYFEHTLLARLMGVELVEGRDLLCSGGKVFMRTTAGPTRVDVIYRRVDDEFLDPLQFRADSMLGAPGPHARRAPRQRHDRERGRQRRRRRQARSTPTCPTSSATTSPRSRSSRTSTPGGSRSPGALEEVLDRLDELVVKPVDGSGGKGLVVGPDASPAELDEARAQRLLADPRGWIAQPVVQLSTIPTLVEDGMRPRHADLRPFAVNDGEDVWVLPGRAHPRRAARGPARRRTRARAAGRRTPGSSAARRPRTSSTGTAAASGPRRRPGRDVTAAIPIIYDGQPEPTHSPQDRPAPDRAAGAAAAVAAAQLAAAIAAARPRGS